jgi:DNA mismatch repair ATPase MutS
MIEIIRPNHAAVARHYYGIKRRMPRGVLLLVRYGDIFDGSAYRAYGTSADRVAGLCGLGVAGRGRVRYCRFPACQIDTRLAQMIRQGGTAAIIDCNGTEARVIAPYRGARCVPV